MMERDLETLQYTHVVHIYSVYSYINKYVYIYFFVYTFQV